MATVTLQQLVQPTAVNSAVVCRLLHATQRNLVISRGSIVDVYRICDDTEANDSPSPLLQFVSSHKIHGEVLGMAATRLPKESVDVLVLCMEKLAVAVVSYQVTAQSGALLQPVALYVLEGPATPQEGLAAAPRIVSTANNTCCAILSHNRLLHILPLGVGKSSGPGAAAPFGNNNVDVWASVLGGDAEGEVERRPDNGTGVSAASACGAPRAIDLLSLSTPLRNVRDLCVLNEYDDPTFMILYEPDQAWVGRVKLDSSGNNVDSRMISCSVSIISFDIRTSTTTVVWSLNNLPYNCTNLYSVPVKLEGALCFSSNCLIHISRKGTTFAAYINTYGKDEVHSDRTPYVAQEATVILADGQKVGCTGISFTLDNAQCLWLNEDSLLIGTVSGEWYHVDVQHRNYCVHYVTFYPVGLAAGAAMDSVGLLTAPSCIVDLETRLGVASSSLFVGSLTGDSLLLRCNFPSEANQIQRTALSVHHRWTSLCPIVDFDFFRTDDLFEEGANYDSCVRNSALVVCSGKDSHSGGMTFVQKHVHLDVFSEFSLPPAVPAQQRSGDETPPETPDPAPHSPVVASPGSSTITAMYSVRLAARKRSREEASMPDVNLLLIVYDSMLTRFLVASNLTVEEQPLLALSNLPTIFACNAGHGSIVQVTSKSVRLHDPDGYSLRMEWNPPEGTDVVDAWAGTRDDGHVTIAVVTSQGALELLCVTHTDVTPGGGIVATPGLRFTPVTVTGLPGTFVLGVATTNGGAFLYDINNLGAGAVQLRTSASLGDVGVLEVASQGSLVVVRTNATRMLLFNVVAMGPSMSDVHLVSIAHNSYVQGPASLQYRTLHPYSSTGGLHGIYVSGTPPLWIVVNPYTGQAFVHPQQVEPLNNMDYRSLCPVILGDQILYAVVVRKDTIRFVFPSHRYDYTSPSGALLMKVYTKATPHFVAVDTMATAATLVYAAESTKTARADANTPSQNRPPHYVAQYQITLFDRAASRLDVLQLDENETVLCLRNVDISLDTEDSGGTRYDSLRDIIINKHTITLLAVGTALPKGDDAPCRGRLILLAIDSQHLTLDIVHKENMKGPVTAVTSCQAYLAMTVGAKVILYYFDWKLRRLIPATFTSGVAYVPKLVAIKSYLLITDAFNSIHFTAFREDRHTIVSLARDAYNLEVTEAEFYFDGNKNLYIVATDVHGNIVFYTYEPLLDGAKGLLTVLADTRVPGYVTRLLRVNSPSPATVDNVTLFSPSLRSSLFYSTTCGSIGVMTTVPDKLQRPLTWLLNAMYDLVDHNAGVHPRTHRIGHREGFWQFGAKKKSPGVVDAELLRTFYEASVTSREAIAKSLGETSTLAKVDDILHHVFDDPTLALL